MCSIMGDLDLTFELTVVTFTYNLFSGYILAIVSFRKLILGKDIG